MLPSFSGWTPYMNFMAQLAMTNPALRAAEESQPRQFVAAPATVPFTNTPEHASSTFVRNIRYLPSSKVAFVKLGNNSYWYKMLPGMLAKWLNSRSLGRYYNNYIKLK